MKLCIDCEWVTREQIAASYDARLKHRCRNEKCGIRQSPVDGSWEYADCEASRNNQDEYTTCGPDARYFKPRDREKESREHAEMMDKFYEQMFPKSPSTKTHWLWTWPKLW